MLSGPARPDALRARLPLRPLETVRQWGSTLVVAPHPDDESLGCGGAITALRQWRHDVHVLFVSDGSRSHPHSVKYPSQARRDLREQEARTALSALGVGSAQATFLRLPDTQVPDRNSSGFSRAAEMVYQCLLQFRPATILVPWRRDPHCDHRASWQLAQEAVSRYTHPLRWLEYPIWIWELAQPEDLPRPADGALWKLNIESVLPTKLQAIAAHVSQTTRLIDDDPEGFILTPAMLSHFHQPYEIYLDHAI